MDVKIARSCYCCKHIGTMLCLADRCMAWNWYDLTSKQLNSGETVKTYGYCAYVYQALH